MNIQPMTYSMQQNRISDLQKQDQFNQNITFQGGFGDKIGEIFGKKYAEIMLNQKGMHNTSKKLAGASDKMTNHMATVGSLLTSSVYFYKTVTNKKLDSDKRTTLGINQIGCFIVPTFCAYAVDYKLKDFNKRMEYRYSGLKRQQMATGQISAEKCEKLSKSLGTKLKCFGALMGLATFTLIYRYATPVLITPVANKIGDWWNDKKKAKLHQTQNIELKPNYDNKKISTAA